MAESPPGELWPPMPGDDRDATGMRASAPHRRALPKHDGNWRAVNVKRHVSGGLSYMLKRPHPMDSASGVCDRAGMMHHPDTERPCPPRLADARRGAEAQARGAGSCGPRRLAMMACCAALLLAACDKKAPSDPPKPSASTESPSPVAGVRPAEADQPAASDRHGAPAVGGVEAGQAAGGHAQDPARPPATAGDGAASAPAGAR